MQSIAFKNLLKHNEAKGEAPAAPVAAESGAAAAAAVAPAAAASPPTADMAGDPTGKVKLPFVIVNTSKDAAISCQMKPDKCVTSPPFTLPNTYRMDLSHTRSLLHFVGRSTSSISTARLKSTMTLKF